MNSEEVIEKETEEPKTPTPEEQLVALQTELKDAREKLEQTEKGLRTAHQTLTEKDKRLKQIESERTDVATLSAKVEVLGGMLSEIIEGREETHSEEEVSPKKKIDYAKKFQEVETMSRLKSEIEPRQRRAETLGIPMDDPRITTIEYLTIHRRFAEADKALDALEAGINASKEKVEIKVEAPKETEAERIERLAEEKALKKLQERGLLKTETGEPSASGMSFLEVERGYIAGKVSKTEYERRARQEGKL